RHRAASAEAAARQAVESAQAGLDAAALAEERIPDLEAKADTLREAEADAARLRRAGGTPQSTHASPLPWDEDAFLTARDGAQKLEKLRQERVQLEAAKTALESSRERQRSELTQHDALTGEQARTKREGQQAKAELDRAQAELEAARAQAGLAAYRSHLHLGEPCPLCEGVVQTLPPPTAHNLAALETRVAALTADLEGRRLRYKEIGLELASLKKSTEERAAELRDWEAQLTQREADLRQLEANVPGDPADTAARLLASLAARVRSAGADPARERQRLLA
ncbi:SMC family ATPase, partial [Deinococcus sp. MIMF12]|nr:SMC family ATPase [Deinococcus rhizophilus]